MRKDEPVARVEPRTGVGTPDDEVEAAGAELGGDTGDVGTPRDTISGDVGGTFGTTGDPEWSTIWQGEGHPAARKHAGQPKRSE